MYSPLCHKKFTRIHFKTFSLIYFSSKTAPGPANFSLKPLVGYKDHDYNSQKSRAPQWSIGIKAKGNIENKSPGPAMFNIEKFTRFGRAFSQSTTMFRRPKDLSKDDTHVECLLTSDAC